METRKRYSFGGNVLYIFHQIWKWDKKTIFWILLKIPCMVLITILETFMLQNVVAVVTEKEDPGVLISYTGLFGMGIIFFYILNHIAQGGSDSGLKSASNKFRILYEKQYMEIDYEILESPAFQATAEKAREIVMGNYDAINRITTKSIELGTAVCGVISYAVILVQISPLIVVIMLMTSTIGYLLYGYNHKWEKEHRSEWAVWGKQMWYNAEKMRDVQGAKDIRIYQMRPWLEKIFSYTLKKENDSRRYRQRRWNRIDTTFCVITLVRDFSSYIILIHGVFTGGLTVAQFVLYFTAMAQFIQWLLRLYDAFDMARFASSEFCDFREYMDGSEMTKKRGREKVSDEACKIQFEKVSYSYPGSEKKVISDVSFTIGKGEKIAIVGLNGAGKTTLVKLLCGLYEPQEGEILVDGKNIREYPKEEYFKSLSAVFQDITFLPKSILENVASCQKEKANMIKFQEAVERAGLKEKIEDLPQKEETKLVTEVWNDAVSLSGGERQKLALARALYQDGKILVLDEPTAALDPIAEDEIYRKYNELSDGRTALFISHRLASTRFCNRIFYMEDGKILEVGSHNQLMELGGKYAEMFRLQSRYYKKAKNSERAG